MLLSDFSMKTNNWIKISVISSIPSKFLLSGFLLLVCTLVRYVYQGNDSVIHLASSVLNTRALYSSTKISLVYQPALLNSEAFIKYHRAEVRLLWLVCYPRSKYERGTDPFCHLGGQQTNRNVGFRSRWLPFSIDFIGLLPRRAASQSKRHILTTFHIEILL